MIRQFVVLVGMILVVLAAVLVSLYILDVIHLAELKQDMGKLFGVMGVAAAAGVVVMLLGKAGEKK